MSPSASSLRVGGRASFSREEESGALRSIMPPDPRAEAGDPPRADLPPRSVAAPPPSARAERRLGVSEACRAAATRDAPRLVSALRLANRARSAAAPAIGSCGRYPRAVPLPPCRLRPAKARARLWRLLRTSPGSRTASGGPMTPWFGPKALRRPSRSTAATWRWPRRLRRCRTPRRRW